MHSVIPSPHHSSLVSRGACPATVRAAFFGALAAVACRSGGNAGPGVDASADVAGGGDAGADRPVADAGLADRGEPSAIDSPSERALGTDSGVHDSVRAPDGAAAADASAPPPVAQMSFFVTSSGTGAKGGDLGGIAGADAKCQALAASVGAGVRKWRAYLSVVPEEGLPSEDARNRIGRGPWFNARGVMVAADVDHLHSPGVRLSAESAVDERGNPIPRAEHAILTGSTPQGGAYRLQENLTCNNWKTGGAEHMARVGHHDRLGSDGTPSSWNSAAATAGCAAAALTAGGSSGRIYCFAAE